MKLNVYYKSLPQNEQNCVVLGGTSEYSKVDIPKATKMLPLLLARLAYVFEIYDEELKDDLEFEDFVEIVLKSVKVKREIQNHGTTLEEVAGVLYLIDSADEVEFVLGEIDEDEKENLGRRKRKLGSFFKNDRLKGKKQ